MQNGTAALEHRLTVLNIIYILNRASPYNPATTLLGSYPGAEKLCSHENLHMDNYSSFIHNCQKFESNQDVLQQMKWMNIL